MMVYFILNRILHFIIGNKAQLFGFPIVLLFQNKTVGMTHERVI